MNFFAVWILSFYILIFLWDSLIEWLNLKHISPKIAPEFEGIYESERYAKSQNYLRDQVQLSLIQNSLQTMLVLLMAFCGGFKAIDLWVRTGQFNTIISGVLFFGVLLLLMQIVSLPFSWYHTFIIEAKFGFNRTNTKTFILDMIKGLLLYCVIGIPIMASVLWFFETLPSWAWVSCWLFVTSFQLLITYIAPTWIMPLFNRFTPLPDNELKAVISDYVAKQQFAIKGIYTMDGSRRSTKSNAYFTGLGHQRRIVLFDTLIQAHSTDELLTILAHEVGHYKKRHILKSMAFSIGLTGVVLYVLTYFIHNPQLAAVFGLQPSVYAGILAFGFLYQPAAPLLAIVGNWLSRKYEYEADAFAITTTEKKDAFIMALKRLSVKNLMNLTPHPLKVIMDYSHPPVLERIQALRRL